MRREVNYFQGMTTHLVLNLIRAQHPDAMSDGDDLGRGTSSFLDIYNQKVGTKTDVQEREMEVKVNRFSKDNPYYAVTDTGPNQKPMSNLMKLISTIKSLIKEGTISDVERSIADKIVTQIFYDGDEPGGRGLRPYRTCLFGKIQKR